MVHSVMFTKGGGATYSNHQVRTRRLELETKAKTPYFVKVGACCCELLCCVLLPAAVCYCLLLCATASCYELLSAAVCFCQLM